MSKNIISWIVLLYNIKLHNNYGCLCDDYYNDTYDYPKEVIKLRGLPWSTTAEDILRFFDGCNVINGTSGIHIITAKEGRPSGIAYVEMEREEDMELACTKDQEYMAHRYIEVFRAKKSEMKKAVRGSKLSIRRALNDGCVRVRGLPFLCTEEEIVQFFDGLDIVKNGITFKKDSKGQNLGEAYVQFKTKEIAEKALEKHKQRMLHRYIEVFRSSLGEVKLEQMSPGHKFPSATEPFFIPQIKSATGYSGMRLSVRNRNGHMRNHVRRSPYSVHMRGLPYKASTTDIVEFFHPLNPVGVHIVYNVDGRASGDAFVEFASREEAIQAVTKDRQKMQHRYIEITLRTQNFE